jgi:hypothetical protein
MGAIAVQRAWGARTIGGARLAILGVSLLLAPAPHALAQAAAGQPPPEAPVLSDPDRPDVTNGARLVGIGLLQVEAGGLFTRPAAGQRAFGTPLTARIGLFEWLEARIGTEGLLVQSDGTTRVTGYGNTQVGAKLRLWADAGGIPVVSILPALNLPTANARDGLGSGLVEGTIVVLTGADLGHHAHVDANYGIGAIGDSATGSRFAQHLVSVSTSDAVTDNWSPYLEIFWFSRQSAAGGSATGLDGGAIYQIGTRLAVDGGMQFGLSRDAPGFAVFGGMSVLVGNVLGRHGTVARQRQAERRLHGQPHL